MTSIKKRSQWSEQDDAALREGLEWGMSSAEILEAYPILRGRSKISIEKRMRRIVKADREDAPVMVSESAPWGDAELAALREGLELPYHEIIGEHPILAARSRASINRKRQEMRRALRSAGELNCRHCGKPVRPPSNLYCSTRCKYEDGKRDLGTRYCIECNKTLQQQPGESRRNYTKRWRCCKCQEVRT